MNIAEKTRRWLSKPNTLPILSIGITIFLAGFIFTYLNSFEQAKFKDQFDATTAIQRTTVADALADAQFALGVIERLYASSEIVTREEFSTMSRTFLQQQPYIQALEWIPQVKHSNRLAIKQAAQESGLENFQITVRTAQGEMEPAPEEEIYYPVFYIEPMAENETALGFDLASDSARSAALQAAGECNCAIATIPITLVQDTESQKAFLLLLPIFSKERDHSTASSWQDNIEGFTLGVYRYPDLFDDIFANVAEKRVNIWIFDNTSDMPNSELLHTINTTNSTIPPELQVEGVTIEDVASHYDPRHVRTETLSFAGRNLTLLFVANEEMVAEATSFQPILAAAIILLLGGIVTSGFWNQARQKTAVEQEVQSRTEQLQKTKNALQESQNRLQLAVKAGQVGVWDFDIQKDSLDWDDMMYTLYGLNPNSATSGYARWRNLVHPEDIASAEKAFQNALQPNGPPFDTEFRIIRPQDQAVRYIRGLASIYRDANGNAIRVIGTNWDITNQKLAQKESIETERQRLANVIEGANVGTWEWDIQTGEIIYNERWAEIIGYTLEEISPITNKTWETVAHPDDLKMSNALVTKHFNNELDYYECEIRMHHKNGSWIWILDRGKVLKWTEDGKPLSMSGTHLDITKRKRIEESLRLFNQVIEYSPVTVMITDTEGTIQYVNPKFTEITGYEADEVIGKNPRILKSGKHTQIFYEDLWNTILAGQEWRGEIQNKRKNGELYWDKTSIAAVKDSNENISHFVAIREDITKSKQREKEHVRQERLAAVGQLSAGIAHDFNNVMAVITLYSQMLQTSPNLTKKEYQQLEIVYQQAQHAAELTKQILDFSRRSVREPRPLDLKTHLIKMLKFIERTIPESIHIHQPTFADECIVNADPTQLQQIITNLTVNARDAMPAGGDLTFKLSRFILNKQETAPCTTMKPGEWIKLSITDTGIGISAKIQAHIFEPFFTTKEVGKGNGLGLAQVYGIVQQHDGCIIVKSRLGQGTTFTIYLPALQEKMIPISNEPHETIPQGQGEIILLVEDNEVLLEATQELLESLNYQVLIATNGAEAIEIVHTHGAQISLILADVVMPQMDGFEMVRRLQKDASPIKVLLMSGFPHDEEMVSEIKLLIAGWLHKPLDLHQVAQTLKDILPQ